MGTIQFLDYENLSLLGWSSTSLKIAQARDEPSASVQPLYPSPLISFLSSDAILVCSLGKIISRSTDDQATRQECLQPTLAQIGPIPRK